MKKLLHLRLYCSWSILLHTVSGASRSLFIFLSGFSILGSGLSNAQTQDELNAALQLQAKPLFQQLATGEKIFRWTGQSGFSYFIQASPNLLDWTWAPNIESGIDGPMSYEVDGPTAAGFFRLIRTDQTAEDLDAADFDGDGYTNLHEITPRPRPGGVPIGVNISPNIQTNPLRKDTDGDGLDDKWEEEHGLDPTDDGSRDINNGPNGDPDGDGVNNLEEQRLGTSPHGNATTTDSDGDGILDFEDAMPGYNLVSWKRSPEGGYALIEIDAPSGSGPAQDLNDKGEVLFPNGIWSAGDWIPRVASPIAGANPEGNTYDANCGTWSRFNNDKRLLGYAHLTFNDGSQAAGGDGLDSPSFWPTAQSTPSLLLETANLWGNPHSSFTPIGVTSNGNMIVRTRRQDGTQTMERYDPSGALLAQMDGTQDFHPNGGWGHGDSTSTGWVASNIIREATTTQSAAYKVGLWDVSNNPIALPDEASGWGYPVSVRDLPNSKVVLTAGQWTGSIYSGRVFLKNPTAQFENATKLGDKKIELFAGDGSALTNDNKLWRNGELTPMADLCARYKQLLEAGSTIHSLRSNQNGTYLVQVESQSETTPTTTSALLLPIEIVDINKSPVSQLKVAKMIEFGVINQNRIIIPDNDRDCFSIRIRGAAHFSPISVKIGTADNSDASYDDDPTQIDLHADGDDMVSGTQLLMADEDDDKEPIGGIEDNQPNDRTHKIQLGGNFVVSALKIGTSNWQAVELKTPVKAIKTVKVNAVILYDKPHANGGVPTVPIDTVKNYFKIANERYAQVGVKLDLIGPVLQDPPLGVDLSDGLTVIPSLHDPEICAETANILDHLGTTSNGDIHVFFVNRLYTLKGPDPAGLAFCAFRYPDELNHTYNAFVGADSLGLPRYSTNNYGGYVVAHELGHLLRNAGHVDNDMPIPKIQIMIEGVLADDGILGSKRFRVADENIIQNDPHAK